MQDKHAEDSDSEREEMELGEIVKLLEKHDPSYMRWVWLQDNDIGSHCAYIQRHGSHTFRLV